MSRQNDITQRIANFNASLGELPPEQVLSAFADLLIATRTNAEANVALIALNAFRKGEKIFAEVDERPRPDVHPLAIYGVGVMGQGIQKQTYLGPMECIRRIRRGIQLLQWGLLERPKYEELRGAIRANAKDHQKTAQRWQKSFDEIESAAAAWYDDRLAETRQDRSQTDRQQLRQELESIEQATPLLHQIVSLLSQTPQAEAFVSPCLVVFQSHLAEHP